MKINPNKSMADENVPKIKYVRPAVESSNALSKHAAIPHHGIRGI